MSERKTWTAEEDQILRELYERRGIKKWSRISHLMESSYNISGRSGKQCRQRYHNHLKGGIRKERWSAEEEEKLVELHSKHGNKWALISKLIAGRTENCVKNMFNSKLRKSVRLLNRFIYLYYRKALKEIKVSFVNRLSEFTEAAHKKPEHQRNHEENTAIDIKNGILMQGDYEVHQMGEQQKMRVKALVQQIHAFKKDNHKHYRTNVLARLRRQKLKQKSGQENEVIEVEQKESNLVTEPVRLEKSEQSRKPLRKAQNNKKQPNIATEEDYIDFVKETSQKQENPTDPKENQPVSMMPQKRSIRRMGSVQSNYSSILAYQGLEKPIQVENYRHNITPTPKCNEHDLMDWSLSVIDWRFNAD